MEQLILAKTVATCFAYCYFSFFFATANAAGFFFYFCFFIFFVLLQLLCCCLVFVDDAHGRLHLLTSQWQCFKLFSKKTFSSCARFRVLRGRFLRMLLLVLWLNMHDSFNIPCQTLWGSAQPIFYSYGEFFFFVLQIFAKSEQIQ